TFMRDGVFSLRSIDKILKSERSIKAIKNSVILAITLSITVNIVGIFIVLVTEYFDIKGSKILRVAYMSTLVFGGMILNNGYLYAYGNKGVLTKLLLNFFPNLDPYWFNGYFAVVFVMTFACTSNYMLFFRNAINGIDYGTVEAAQNMGADQWSILKKVVLPTVKPMIITLIIMNFQTGLGAMSAPLMVGGQDFQTISPLILTFANRPSSRDIAALLSLLLGFSQLILLYVMTSNEKKGNFLSISKTKVRIKKQKINNKFANIVVHILSYILFVIYSLPVILVIIFSFQSGRNIESSIVTMDGFTLENYIRILTDQKSYGPFANSFIYSFLSAGAVVIIMLVVVRIIMKYKNKLTEVMEYLFFIPWLLPSLMIALGLIVTYDRPRVWMFNMVLVGNQWIVPLAYFIVMIPSTLRYLKAAYYSFDQNLEDASRILGARGFITMFKVILPALLPTALALFALNFNGKLSDYDLSAFLYHPTSPTLGIVIRSNADATASVDARAINLVYSVILMAISTIVLYFVYGRGTSTAEAKGGITAK
ncbi:MAG: iron ABC transporter permease, partial [Erysipelotrichaceae bacterium]